MAEVGFPDLCSGRSQTEDSKLRHYKFLTVLSCWLTIVLDGPVTGDLCSAALPIIIMAKPDFFSPYLKARLRPLMQPKLWASVGILCLSAFVLVRMFVQPDAFLGNADDNREGAANQEANETLTPEERAIAAELDDIAVLLQALDDEGTIESALSDENLAQASEPSPIPASDALKNLDLESLDVEIPNVDYDNFQSLPLLDLNPIPNGQQRATLGQSNGFIGLNSVSADPALNLPTLSSNLSRSDGSTQTLSPLEQALERFAPNSSSSVLSSVSPTLSNGTTSGGVPSGTTTADTATGSLTDSLPASSATPSATLPIDSAPFSTLQSNPATTATNPAAQPGPLVNSNLQQPQVQGTTPVPNAFTQLQNPQFSAPATPSLPTSPPTPPVPSLQVPVTTAPIAQPQFGSTSTAPVGQFSSGQFSTGTTSPGSQVPSNPAVTNSPIFPQAPGTPVFQQPAQSTPSFSVPNRPPGQNIGGGQINTFSNP